jgi:hypothetical protein
MVAPAQIAGQRFGRLVAVRKAERPDYISDSAAYWLFLCDCGAERVIRAKDVRYGKTASCGCFHAEAAAARKLKHGSTRRISGDRRVDAPEYRIWSAMRARCAGNDPDYGGRGIHVCARWNEFANFLADMGRRPSRKHSIDRINNEGHYEPANCRWATTSVQANNRRITKRFTVRGITGTVAQLATAFGLVSGPIARQRMARFGWSAEDAVMVPQRPRGVRGLPTRNA